MNPVVDRRTLLAIGSVLAGVAVLWRPAATLVSDPGFEFVGPGAAIPVLAVVIGVALVVRGVQLLSDS